MSSQESERSKIFDNDDFGYRRIVVERPLRLELPGFAGADRTSCGRRRRSRTSRGRRRRARRPSRRSRPARRSRQRILGALATLDADRVWKNREQFQKALDGALTPVGRVAAPVRARRSYRPSRSGTRRPTSASDAEGKPEPDAELRDYENVPLQGGHRTPTSTAR